MSSRILLSCFFAIGIQALPCSSVQAQRSLAVPVTGEHYVTPKPVETGGSPTAKLHNHLTHSHHGGALGVSVQNDLHLPTGHVLILIRKHRLLYAINAKTMRSYPVAVGKSGATWRGTVVVGAMSIAPGWHPTAHERRQRRLPAYVAPGPHNPLGVRAIYLYRGHRDTLLRIHGTNQPGSIGHSVSAGCIRMRNADVMDLYDRVHVGTVVTAR